ncbi:MAG: Rrf2 family transcriptional regulator [Coriobacteriaceae bacterium]|nr:Rrf2 family transcriptional regulator [Coriobacteriaceae bacterium]
MNISRKTDYALRMLAMLAQSKDTLLSVRTAADEVNVPYSFARSIQHGLVQAGIVESLRGVHGGMRLRLDPREVTVRQIVEAIQGPMVVNDCTVEDASCERMGCCCYHPIWAGTQALVHNYLDSVTLDDVVNHRLNPAVDPKFADRDRFLEYAGCAGGCKASRAELPAE